MTSNFLKFTVIFLAILIFICFAFLLYGLYSKISNTEGLTSEEITSYSLNLSKAESIKDIKTIIKAEASSMIYSIPYGGSQPPM